MADHSNRLFTIPWRVARQTFTPAPQIPIGARPVALFETRQEHGMYKVADAQKGWLSHLVGKTRCRAQPPNPTAPFSGPTHASFKGGPQELVVAVEIQACLRARSSAKSLRPYSRGRKLLSPYRCRNRTRTIRGREAERSSAYSSSHLSFKERCRAHCEVTTQRARRQEMQVSG